MSSAGSSGPVSGVTTARSASSATASGSTVVWPVFAILVVFGSARAFMMPATQAILINLVPPASFSRAVALSSSTFHVAVIAGPVLGGLLYLAGPKVVYAIVAGLLLVSVVLILGVTTIASLWKSKKDERAGLEH